MRLAIVADAFPPMASSAAVQIFDLAQELVDEGHLVTVLVPDAGLATNFAIETRGQIEVVRVRSPRTKDLGYARRVVGELVTPYLMARHLDASLGEGRRYDGVICYSPSIFLTPLVKALKRRSGCPSYLILRDIFPQWARDMGILRPGPVYWFLSSVARSQYIEADVIGVQSASNLAFLEDTRVKIGARLEVLQNWFTPRTTRPCRIRIAESPMAGRRIIVYAGNMGVAQGMDAVIDLAQAIKSRADIGIVMVGRGSEVVRLRQIAASKQLPNIQFYDEIPSDQIPGLFEQADAGLVLLDRRHRSHNIPGKFVAYMHHGLPALALVSSDTDLADVISSHGVGAVLSSDPKDLADINEILRGLLDDALMPARCTALAEARFSPRAAATQIVSALAAAHA